MINNILSKIKSNNSHFNNLEKVFENNNKIKSMSQMLQVLSLNGNNEKKFFENKKIKSKFNDKHQNSKSN